MSQPVVGPRHPKIGRFNRSLAVLALASLVAGCSVVATPQESSAATAVTVSSSPKAVVPSAKKKSVSLPRAAYAVGTIEDWTLADPTVIASVGPEVGSVKSGAVALGIDAPIVTKTRTAAWAKAAVAPQTSYTFEAYARVSSKTEKTVAASFGLGSKTIKLPKLNATWKKITGTYTTGATETSMNIAVRVSKAVRGLSVDAVKLYATKDATKANVAPNGSFESVGVKRGIVSSSLVMTTPTAALAVSLPAGKTTWEVRRGKTRVAKGSITMKGRVAAIPLKGVKQGFYTVSVTAKDKKTVKTTIAVIDSPNRWLYQDKRYGVAVHVDRPIYADAALHTRALGIAEARNDIHWRFVEKKKGVYDFSGYDAPFAKMAAQGIKVLGIAGYGNPIYGKANAFAPITKAAITAYGKYAAAAAKRYNLSGLEVYNEFNHAPKNLSSCTSANCYIKILKSVGTAVGKVKPKLPIVAGATAQYDDAWFRKLWQLGGMKYADAVSYHPYYITGAPERLTGIVKKSRTTMKKYGKTTKPIWLTELGTSSRTGNRTPVEQSSVLVRSSVLAFASGLKKFYWYDLINDGPDKADQESNFGLYSHPVASVAGLAPKQAGFNQALTIAQLGGRNYRASEKLGSGVVSYAFGSKSNTVRVVWAPKGTKTATIKTTKPVVVVDFNGVTKTVKPKSGKVKVKVTKNPVFIRSGSATAGVTK